MTGLTSGLRRRLLLPAWQGAEVAAAAGVLDRIPDDLFEAGDDGVPASTAVQAPDGSPSAPARATFAIAAGPGRLVIRAGTASRRRLTLLALGDEVGASLSRDLDAPEAARPVEHSVFSLDLLAEELARCLPVVPLAPAPRSGLRRADPALLLAATAGDSSMTPGRIAVAAPEDVVRALSSRFDASLEVTAVHDGTSPLVDRLVWFAADGQWWHARPDSDLDGQPVLDVVPVVPDDLPRAVAPLLSGLLTAAQP